MALKFAFLVISLVVLLFCLDKLLPRLIGKYKKYNELKTRKEREEAFRIKMKQLEII